MARLIGLSSILFLAKLATGATEQKQSPFIWRGTKWCGIGEAPTGENSNVNLTSTDLCCKMHDACPYYISRWKKKYNLFNWRFYTISSCSCDEEFRKCLQKVNTMQAKDIERIYFGMLKVPCFEIQLKETKKCVEWYWYLKCKTYASAMEAFATVK